MLHNKKYFLLHSLPVLASGPLQVPRGQGLHSSVVPASAQVPGKHGVHDSESKGFSPKNPGGQTVKRNYVLDKPRR